jgi:cobalt-zinc-cadmium efflux system outer membrane protein
MHFSFSRFLISALLLVSSGAAAMAAEYSLAGVADRVRSHHPGLKAARLTIEEARGRRLGAGRLANPVAGIEVRPESRLEPGNVGFSFEQAFPITKRLQLEKQRGAQGVAAAELEVRDAERRLAAEAQSLAVRLLALDAQQALRDEQTDLAKKLSDFVKGRVKAGEISPLEAAQAQVDAQRLLLEARRVETERVSLTGQLKPMLGVKAGDKLRISGKLPAPKIPEADPLWTQRPDYQLSRAKAEAAETDTALARSKKWQDVNAGVVGGPEWQRTTSGRDSAGFVGFQLSIPLPIWNRNEGEIAEKIASAERARLESEALGKVIESEAETARQEMIAHAALARETRQDLLPLVVEQAKALEKAYETGQTDLLSVLRAREQRLQLEAAALDAERDFHLARVRHEAATGGAP